MYLDQQLYSLESIQAFSDISGVFNDELVQAILDESGLPTQQSQSFDIKKPSLAYSGNLESQLLTIYELLTLDDKDLAKEKVEKLPLSKASKKLMTTAVDAYVLSTTDASGESSSTANAEAGDDESSEEE